MGVVEEEMIFRKMAIGGFGKRKDEKEMGVDVGSKGVGEEGGKVEKDGVFVVEGDGEGGGGGGEGIGGKGGVRERVEGIGRMLGIGGGGDVVESVGGGLLRESGGIRVPSGREVGLFAWEVLVIVALLALLRRGVARTLRLIHTRLGGGRGLKWGGRIVPYENSVFECMQRPLEFAAIFMVGTALAEAVSRPLAAAGLLRYIRKLRELGVIFAATWFLLRWIDRIKTRFAADKRIDKAQVDATSRISTVATTLIALLISLDTIGINIQTVLAFGGIGGVAIGFAGREIISNFFGGFMIYITRPFTVGEWIRSIESNDVNGTVEDIGWYLTRVRTWDKRPLYIPNSRFSTLIIENPSRMSNRRILHTVHLRLEDMSVVRKVVDAILSLLMRHPGLDPKQHRLVYVDGFDEFSVRVWISCYTKSVFLYDFRSIQQQILLDTYDIIRSRGARLATITTRDVRQGDNPDRYGPLGDDILSEAQTIREEADQSNGKPVYGKSGTIDLDSLGDGRSPVPLFGDGEGPRDVPVFATLWDKEKPDFFNIESGVRRTPEGGDKDSDTQKTNKEENTAPPRGKRVQGSVHHPSEDKMKKAVGSKGEKGINDKHEVVSSNQRPGSNRVEVAGAGQHVNAPRGHANGDGSALSSSSHGAKGENAGSVEPISAQESNGNAAAPEERRMKFSAAPKRGSPPAVQQPSSKRDESIASKSGATKTHQSDGKGNIGGGGNSKQQKAKGEPESAPSQMRPREETARKMKPTHGSMKISGAPSTQRTTAASSASEANALEDNVRPQPPSGGKPNHSERNGGSKASAELNQKGMQGTKEKGEGKMKISKAPPRPKMGDETVKNDSEENQ